VINTGDLGTALDRGVAPEHFPGYHVEWEWLSRYLRMYREMPSADVLASAFPDFPYRRQATEVAYYADQVVERANQRTVKAAVLSATEALTSGSVAEALGTMVGVRLVAPAARGTDAIRSSMVADQLDAEYDIGVPFPWLTLHNNTGGMRPGDFVVFGGRTGVGKSWTLVHTAVNAALQGLCVRYLSLEMPSEQLVARVHSTAARALGMVLRHTELHRRTTDRIVYKQIMAKLADQVPGRIDVVDSSDGRITPSTVGARRGEDLVVVDYLGLMSLPVGARAVDDWRVMASISNQLKELAIQCEVPVLAAVQINREGAKAMGMPGIKDIAQSDAIGQDADVFLAMRRMGPAMKYNLAKNRHGPSDVVFYSRFDPDLGEFGEVSRDTAEQLRDDAEDP